MDGELCVANKMSADAPLRKLQRHHSFRLLATLNPNAGGAAMAVLVCALDRWCQAEPHLPILSLSLLGHPCPHFPLRDV